MDLASFLRDNQAIMAPIIEWGGAIFLVALVLSPIIIIRHQIFRPTRWWHIVGAYLSSFFLFIFVSYVLSNIDQWLTYNYLTTFELSGAYNGAHFKQIMWLLFIFPASVFYSAKLLMGKFSRNSLGYTVISAVVFTAILWAVAYNLFVYFLGQALMNLS